MVMSDSRQRKLGTVLSYAYSVAQAIVYIIYVPLLLSGIGPDEYGLYQLVGSMAAYIVSIGNILSYGVGRYYCMYCAEGDVRNMENTLAIAKRLYWAFSVIAFAAFGLLAGAVQLIYANSFSASQLQECSAMLIVLAVNLMVTMNNAINVAAITARERFVFQNTVQLVMLVVQPVLVIISIQFMPNALMATLIVLFANCLASLIRRFYATSVLKAKHTYHGWDKGLATGLVRFSGVILLVTVADQIFWNTDQLIIGYFFNAGAVAIYAVGSQIFKAYMPIGTAISGVFLPRISRLYHRDNDMKAIEGLLLKVGRIAAYALLLVLSGFIVFGQSFITLWVGDGYMSAFWIALVIMTPFTIDLIQNTWLTLLQVMNKYLFRGIMYLIISVCNLFATVFAVQQFGIVGAACVTAISCLLGNGVVMNWYYAKKIGINVKAFWISICKIVVLAVCASFVAVPVWSLITSSIGLSWGAFAIGVLVYLVIYFVIMYVFAMNPYERSLVSKYCMLNRR